MVMTDRQLVTIRSNHRSSIRFERKLGRPLTGRVRGLEDVDLRVARLTIQYWGPEEEPGRDGKPSRRATTFAVLLLTSNGEFTTDPIPPGKYWAELFAVKTESPSASQSDFRGQLEFSIPETGDMPQIEVVAKPVTRRVSADTRHEPALRVLDEDRKPIPKVEVMAHSPSGGGRAWFADNGSNVLFGSSDLPPVFNLIVRADGYASGIEQFAGADREKLLSGKASMTLHRGEKVRIRFRLSEGQQWPESWLPEVYFQQCASQVRTMHNPGNRKNVLSIGLKSGVDFNMLNAHPESPGEFSLQLAPDTPPFYVGVHIPGFLQAFDVGPFTAKDVRDGILTVELPKPAMLQLAFDPGTGEPAKRPFKSTAVQVMQQIP